MCHANKEKQKTTNDGTSKSRKNQNAWRKGNYKYLGILEADTIKHAKLKKKIHSIPQENEKSTRKQTTL